MEIKFYFVPDCPWCDKVRHWLKSKRYGFEEQDVDDSSNARDELLEKTGQLGVPMTDFGGDIVLGFNEKALEETFQRNKQKK